MANQPENPTYDAGIYQIETGDPVLGGVGGATNTPLLGLANRTAYLKLHVDDLEAGNTIPPTVAPLNSPVFTGDPRVPTAAAGDNDTSAASTAWVQRRYRGRLSRDIAGGSNVTLTVDEAGYGIIALTGTITANINVIVPTATGRWIFENKTVGSFTVTIRPAAGGGATIEQGKSREVYCDGTDVYATERQFNDTVLTGTPTAPTPTQGTSNTQVSNTAFLQQTVYGLITKDVAGGSTTVLSAAEAGNGILVFTGAITADKDVEVPASTKSWIVINDTTGSFSLTLTTDGGDGVILPRGQAVFAYCDGTDVALAGSANQNILTTTRIVATGGQTTFNLDYTPGALIVFQNGALLDETEYTADNGSQVVLDVGATAGDELVFYVFSSLEVANVEPQLPYAADTYLQRNAGNTAFETRTAAQVGADVGPHVQAGTTSAAGILRRADLATMNTGSDTSRVPAVNVVAAYVASQIAALVDSSPAALDTLNELAAALNNDPDAFTTLNNAIAARLVATNNLSDLTSDATARNNLNLGSVATRDTGVANASEIPDRADADARYAPITPASIPDYRAGRVTYILEQMSLPVADIDANITESTDQTVGPTGSGADYEWSALDTPVAEGATAIFVRASISVSTSSAGYTVAWVRACSNDVISTLGSDIKAQLEFHAGAGSEVWRTRSSGCPIALDDNGMFKVRWTASNDASREIHFDLEGFIT